jgi:transposase InsO family protein
MPASVIRCVVELRQSHPRWGARKLRQRLVMAGVTPLPACSTITRLLHRAGLIGAASPPGQRAWQRFEHIAPNRLWQMDFKGAVPTWAQPVHPLTIVDDHSRFNLCLQALPNQQTATVQAALIPVLRRYGLPNRLLVDNGSPWGDSGGQPYTRLTVWLLRVGIRVTHSRPYHPQTLGKGERFHGTLTREVLAGAQWDDGAQLQQALDRWRVIYNHERPHEALALAVPASRYQPSLRAYPETLPPLEYDETVAVRRVQQQGTIHFQGYCLHVSKAFTGYPVGLRPGQEDGQYEVLFGHHRIQTVDLRTIIKKKV